MTIIKFAHREGSHRAKASSESDCIHESSQKHVTGTANYIDDLPMPVDGLHAYIGLSDCTHGIISSIDLDAVRTCPGVIDVFTANDVPGINDISPTGKMDEPILAETKISFWGQPIFVVVAESRNVARYAARLANIEYKRFPFSIDIKGAEKVGGNLVTEPLVLNRGDVENDLRTARNRVLGEIEIGGQDHFYLEGHIALATAGEDDNMTVLSSTQHPSEVQHMVSRALSIPISAVTVKVRRMGGGFGGKETQSNQFAAIVAIAAQRLNTTIKLRLDRDDDMICTGKRHDVLARYDVGFDDNGNILALDVKLSARCGFSSDLSGPVTDRALFHIDNCYFIPSIRLRSFPLYTNTVSNTAFRGFGGPQGMLVGERVIQEIAFALKKDPLEIRKLNFYAKNNRNITPYYQKIEDNIILKLVKELEETSNYINRRKEIAEFNKVNQMKKKGISLTPVKFGISFTATWFNQAAALLNIYTDGSIMVNHGGTEMGQGLHTKVCSIVSTEFGLPLSKIRLKSTNTSKVPNTSATAASSGSDLNGMAVLNAISQLKKRLANFAVKEYSIKSGTVSYNLGMVSLGSRRVKFDDFIKSAYMARVQLSASGFYKTPKIHWDRKEGKGRPFYYFSYGAAVSEVVIDALTGEYKVDRVDILHDVGNSMNEAIDIGQIEGGFIQGMGWLTSEELWWDTDGKLVTHSPSTYKIPLASDRPRILKVNLANWSKNKERTIRRSKAVGEPPFMLAISVHEALTNAVAATSKNRRLPKLNAPATPERILKTIKWLQDDTD